MKRLVLLLDGTWNTDFGDRPTTNIVRLREILAGSLREAPPPSGLSEGKAVTGLTDEGGIEHAVHYDSGVGTGWGDWLSGAIFGRGLTTNIRQAYRFLSRNYEPGDEIFIFGFSRGAYTARSLVGYIAAIGLLRCEFCTDENERRAWQYYRTPPHNRAPGEYVALKNLMHDREATRITCMGVFDTVGALGVPLQRFSLFNRERHGFHDVELGSKSDVNLHAVALDERRGPFEPTLWFKPKFKHFDEDRVRIEQVWFPGVHSDVGGGYVERDGKQPGQDARGLDDLALDWMIRRLRSLCPGLPLSNEIWRVESSSTISPVRVGPADALLPQHSSMSVLYLFLLRALRRVNGSLPRRGWLERYPTDHPHNNVLAEMVHISAIVRLGRRVDVETWPWWVVGLLRSKRIRELLAERSARLAIVPQRRSFLYRPVNVLCALDGVSQLYLDMPAHPRIVPTRVAGYDGEPVMTAREIAKAAQDHGWSKHQIDIASQRLADLLTEIRKARGRLMGGPDADTGSDAQDGLADAVRMVEAAQAALPNKATAESQAALASTTGAVSGKVSGAVRPRRASISAATTGREKR